MAKNKVFIPNALRPWIEARRRFRLSHVHIQMARALGMNPKKFGKLDNHRQEPWKAPLPEFIARLYVRRFGAMPDKVMSIEQMAAAQRAKRQAKKEARKARKAAAAGSPRADGTGEINGADAVS